MWRKVWREVQLQTRGVLIALAEHPGAPLTIPTLAEAIGSETRQVQNALSSLTKRMKKYGPTKWPFIYYKDGRTGRYSYEMDEATAPRPERSGR